MNTFFAFIDESGSYKKQRSQTFVQRTPYYAKACFLVKSIHWKKLSAFRKTLCKKYGIGVLNELKCNHLWKLQRRDVKNLPIHLKCSEEFLEDISFDTARNYIRDFLSSIPEYHPLILCSITPLCVFSDKVDEAKLERMHYQDLMQRIELEMSDRGKDDLAVLFSDKLSQKNQEQDVRDSYHSLFHSGDLVEKYDHIMDSMSFQHSHQCCGLQMADFIAGFIVGFLRGFPFSQNMFTKTIMESLRKGSGENTLGYGIFDVPKRAASRSHLEEKFGDSLIV